MHAKWTCVAVAVACLAWGASASAEVTIETVPVGNAGNAGEPSGSGDKARICGAVDYAYNIGKYEVTAGQYTEFLNAVAETDTYGLYKTKMDTDIWYLGCNIKRNGSPGSYTYSVDANWANRPVNYVSWSDAARFANWLHNSQAEGNQDLTTTEGGSYYLNGMSDDANLLAVTREPNATWVIPTEDEWYKSAYHKNDGIAGNYWDYPTGTDARPGGDVSEATNPGNNANYYYDPAGYPIDSHYRTVVGEFELSESPYGTFDQGGNVFEYNEAIIDGAYRGKRGGSFGDNDDKMRSFYRELYTPDDVDAGVGFRVVLVPEPATLSLLAAGGLGIFLKRKRRLLTLIGGMVLGVGVIAHPAIAGIYPQTREYMLGDIDDFNYEGLGTEDDVYVDPDWLMYVITVDPPDPIDGFDVLAFDHSVPFTFEYGLAGTEAVVGAMLSVALRTTDPGLVDTDGIFLDGPKPDNRYGFTDLAWLPIPTTGTSIRTLDLSNVLGDSYLPLLQDGQFNVLIRDDVAIDYAILTVEVMPEPATLALLAVGGLLMMRKRRAG